MPKLAADASLGLVEQLDLAPLREGPLDGLRFTVKDNIDIDIAGHKTSYAVQRGETHIRHQLITPFVSINCSVPVRAASARLSPMSLHIASTGRASILAHRATAKRRIVFLAAPPAVLRPRSAMALPIFHSARMRGGGAIRVPASLCGLWGMRPSLHRISEAGVLPFQPSVSTVGLLADRCDVLDTAMRVLLNGRTSSLASLKRIFVLQDALELADAAVQEQFRGALDRLVSDTGIDFVPIRFSEIVGEPCALRACNLNALRDLQTAEFQSTVRNWIEAFRPELGFTFAMAYGNVQRFDRIAALDSIARCEHLLNQINAFFAPDTIICFPTTPKIAPKKGSLNTLEAVMDFYDPTMTITAFSGVAHLPEVSAPLMTVEGCPVGLSFVAGHYRDEFLLDAVRELPH